MKHLVPCPECNRHVRVSELECPFCALPLDLANTPPPQLPRGRLSRAATLAFGATLVSATAISACSDGAVANLGGGVPVYDAPPSEVAGAGSANGGSGGAAQPSAGQSGVAGSPNLGSGGGTVYGGPPSEGGVSGTIDLSGAAAASGEAGADAVQDGGGKGGGPFAVYGGPP